MIKHGFWDKKKRIRRTIVLVYSAKSGTLENVCYIQQNRLPNGETATKFDVSGVEREDIKIMQRKVKKSIVAMRKKWIPKAVKIEQLTVSNGQYRHI